MGFYSSPTYNLDTKEWSQTEFESRKSTVMYIRGKFKYPGEYNLKYTQGVWNEQAELYRETKSYPKYTNKSIDFRKHWDAEKDKCKFNGFIIYIKPSESLEFAVPGLFYFYLNYCPVPDKMKAALDFVEIWDSDYHYFLYILLCVLERKFGAILKARQKGYTLKNMAIMLNCIWFGQAAVAKIFAQEKSKVEDAWGFMEIYRDHINNYCGWKRGFDPGKKLDWQIRRKKTDGSYGGNKSIAKGFTTKQDPTNGIGGNATFLYGEESGANGTLGLTHEFITSNVAIGGLTTGLIIYSGAVGELENAEDLKTFIYHPRDYGFLYCKNYIEEDAELGEEVGFFAAEWWNYISVEEDEEGNQFGEILRCYNIDGNTNKELALIEISKHRARAKQRSPEKYRYYCSQRPLSIIEAFAHRKESIFPLKLVAAQKRRIEEKQYPIEYLDIIKNEKSDLVFVKSAKLPIRQFPFPKASPDKEGCIEVYERPIGKPELGKQYVASIDPTKGDKTITSVSLFCVIIYKLDIEVRKYGEEIESWIEPGKVVAECTGRFDDENKTHQRAQYLLEIYNARVIVEVNVSDFITHMRTAKKQHHLVKSSEMFFLKEEGYNNMVFSEYGWKNTGKLFEQHLIKYLVNFLKEELSILPEDDGNPYRIIYGITRIPSLMVMKELEAYKQGLNVDRLITMAALVAYVKLYLANHGYAKRIDDPDKHLKVDKSFYAKQSSFFTKKNLNMGDSKYQVKKSPFRHIK